MSIFFGNSLNVFLCIFKRNKGVSYVFYIIFIIFDRFCLEICYCLKVVFGRICKYLFSKS